MNMVFWSPDHRAYAVEAFIKNSESYVYTQNQDLETYRRHCDF